MPTRSFSAVLLQLALLTLAALLSPLQVAGAAMTGKASATKFCLGEEIHTGEEATARVLSVREAGAVEQGAGHVVTGTFQTWNADVRELWMEGLEAPVRVTGGHRFYSASRGWVEAHRLVVGETVRTRDGSGARVQGLERLPGVHAVFNLEVEGLHQYHVSPLGLLAHNNDCREVNGGPKAVQGANEAAESGGDAAQNNTSRGRKVGGETDATIDGKRAHNNYKTALGDEYDPKVVLPSGKKPDAVNWDKLEVRELKPDNPRAVKRGQKQVDAYRRELEQVTGKKWSSVVDTYQPKKKRKS